jgi:hypothetical protein
MRFQTLGATLLKWIVILICAAFGMFLAVDKISIVGGLLVFGFALFFGYPDELKAFAVFVKDNLNTIIAAKAGPEDKP